MRDVEIQVFCPEADLRDLRAPSWYIRLLSYSAHKRGGSGDGGSSVFNFVRLKQRCLTHKFFERGSCGQARRDRAWSKIGTKRNCAVKERITGVSGVIYESGEDMKAKRSYLALVLSVEAVITSAVVLSYLHPNPYFSRARILDRGMPPDGQKLAGTGPTILKIGVRLSRLCGSTSRSLTP
jgi:hypothetical protein